MFINNEKQFTRILIYDNVTLHNQKKSIEIEYFRKFHDNVKQWHYFNVRVDMYYTKKQ